MPDIGASKAIEQNVRSFLAVWGERDRQRRRLLVSRACTADVRYCDPFAMANNCESFTSVVGEVRAQISFDRLQLTTKIDTHHQVARFGWVALDSNQVVLLNGMTFIEFDGTFALEAISSFFGPVPALVYTIGTTG